MVLTSGLAMMSNVSTSQPRKQNQHATYLGSLLLVEDMVVLKLSCEDGFLYGCCEVLRDGLSSLRLPGLYRAGTL